MTDVEKRSHDLALRLAEFIYNSKAKHPTFNPTNLNAGFYETYINAYNDFIEAFNRDDVKNE